MKPIEHVARLNEFYPRQGFPPYRWTINALESMQCGAEVVDLPYEWDERMKRIAQNRQLAFGIERQTVHPSQSSQTKVRDEFRSRLQGEERVAGR